MKEDLASTSSRAQTDTKAGGSHKSACAFLFGGCCTCGASMTLAEKEKSNTWDHISDFVKVWNARKAGEWEWIRNTECKYVELRIDMRDGGCIIKDRHGNRIMPEQLAYQYRSESEIARATGAECSAGTQDKETRK